MVGDIIRREDIVPFMIFSASSLPFCTWLGSLPYQNLQSGFCRADPLFVVQDHMFHHFPYSSVLDRWRGRISKIDFWKNISSLSFHFFFFVYILCLLFHIEFVSVCALPLRKFMADHFVLPPSLLAFEAVESKSTVVVLVCHSLSLVHSWWWCFSFLFSGKRKTRV